MKHDEEVVKLEDVKEEKSKDYEKTELDQLGNNLPIIRKVGDQFIEDRTFKFKDWTMPIEEKISELKRKSKTTGLFVTAMLDLLLDEFNGKAWEDYTKEERVLILNQLEFANVVYMYAYLRVEEIGEKFAMTVICPYCENEMKNYEFDLRTMDVNIKNKYHPREKTVKLSRPIYMDDDQKITGFVISHAKWDFMEKTDSKTARNEALMKKLMFGTAIQSFECDGEKIEKFYSVHNVVNKMKKRDIEHLAVEVGNFNAGPLMMMEGDCNCCGRSFMRMVNWGYDDFFVTSSLS